MMQDTETTKALLRAMEPLSAYGEYSEEAVVQAAKKVFRPYNHLADALSPYLRLHAGNPVGWYEWGDEAFQTALREDRPLFVNIGFYSEHWCRFMERDCFSDNEVADMINDVFIPVCVDREVRPDINDLFMQACRLQNGSAGWPLNILLTPEGKPFFCTTWLPKRATGKVPGITEILPRVKWLWHVQRDVIEREAQVLDELMRAKLSELAGLKHRGRRARNKAHEAVSDLRSIFDVQWGGFGGVPKLPEPAKMLFLLHQADSESGASKFDQSDALSMTDITLRRMWRGGIHDHLGGGFSRYAVDERWLVPHFEKLLADQAALLYAVSLAQKVQNSSFYRLFAEDIIFCVTKYFSDDAAYSQGFRSSVCADFDGSEGKYYLWSEEEIKHVLPDADVPLFCAAYGVLPSGNFGPELGGSQIAQNILYEASTVTDLGKRFANSGIKPRDVAVRLANDRKLLLDYRDKRYPLNSDNKILMGANGLMIAALCRASIAFDCNEWRDIAERSALFLQKNLRDKNGKYYRVWIDGKLAGNALTEDYAYFLFGLVELYNAALHFKSGEKQLSEWLNSAKELADTFIAECWDDIGGFVLTDKSDKYLFAQLKACDDLYSMPNANSVAAIALTQLGIILEDKKYSDYARNIIDCFAGYARQYPLSALTMITADLLYKPVKVKPPAPVPTDEELNAPEPVTPEVQEVKKPTPQPRRQATERRRRASHSRARER